MWIFMGICGGPVTVRFALRGAVIRFAKGEHRVVDRTYVRPYTGSYVRRKTARWRPSRTPPFPVLRPLPYCLSATCCG